MQEVMRRIDDHDVVILFTFAEEFSLVAMVIWEFLPLIWDKSEGKWTQDCAIYDTLIQASKLCPL